MFIFAVLTVHVCYSQNRYVQPSETIRLLNLFKGEELTKDQLKQRLYYGRILQPTLLGDSVIFKPENLEAIKALPIEYVELTESYFKLLNDFIRSLDAKQKTIIKNYISEYKIYICVIVYYLKVKNKKFVLETTKKNLIDIGMTESEYNEFVDQIQRSNEFNSKAINLIVDETIYKEPITTIFFPNCVIKLLDGTSRMYNRFVESYYDIMRAFENKQKH